MNPGNQGYFASLFHPDFGTEMIDGRLFIDRFGIKFVSEQFTQQFPVDTLEATWDPALNRICFRDSGNPNVAVFTFDELVLRNPGLPQIQELREEIEASRNRREFSRRTKITLGVLAAIVLVTACFSWGMGLMVKIIAGRIPAGVERRFGEEALKELKVDVNDTSHSNEVALVAELAQPLLQAIPRLRGKVKFYVTDESDPNAFALPGGFVVVTTGLLETVERPEELQGVLAHELAHVTERHIFRQLIAGTGPMLVMSVFFGGSGLGGLLAAGSGVVISQGFSKDYETEADEVGWDYLVAANIDPRGAISMFEKFLEFGGDWLPEGLSSHPLLQKRIARLQKKWEKLDRKSGFLEQKNPFKATERAARR